MTTTARQPAPDLSDGELRARWASALEAWIKEHVTPHNAPPDWGASGECARLMAWSMRRFATSLGGDLTDPEVRRDLRHVAAFVALMLYAGDAILAHRGEAERPSRRPRRKEPPRPLGMPSVAGVLEQARMFAECGESA